MKRKRILAIGLIASMMLSNMAMVSMAETQTVTSGEVLEEILVKATPSDAEEKVELPEDDTFENRILEATPSDAIHVSTEEELWDAIGSDNSIVLDGDIALTEKLIISGDVSIELRGGKLSVAGDGNRNAMIEIRDTAKVTLGNIEIDCAGLDYKELNSYGYGVDYYAILMNSRNKGAQELFIEEGTLIHFSGIYEELSNDNLRGLWTNGYCEMNGGVVRQMPAGGIIVGRGSTFVFNEGEVTECESGLAVIGARDDMGEGLAKINGGRIRNNFGAGIYNQGIVEMEGGEIAENGYYGIYNSNEDGLSHQEFSPDATINGGTIANNRSGAILNEKRGTVTITGGDVLGHCEGFELLKKQREKVAETIKSVIKNDVEATLNIFGGTIASYADNEIAVLNGATGKIVMTGGQITATGKQAMALKNENKKLGDVKISGGVLSATGEEGIVIDNQGSMELSGDVVLEEGGIEKIYVSVVSNVGGTITPGSQIVSQGQEITYQITPQSGYKISDVKVDGISQGPISSYKLTIAESRKYSIEAAFTKISGGGSSSGGGGGGSKTTTAQTGEVGTWVQDQTGWWFKRMNGTYPASAWIMTGGNWFQFNDKGYMVTGWFTDVDGKKFYLNPTTGSSQGVMMTGWQLIEEKWYYFNTTSDGTKGALLVNGTTPDGFAVGADGVWIQK